MTEAAAKPQVQWIEAEMACGAKQRCAGDGMEIQLLGGGARLRIRDNPACPIRRQVIPRIEEADDSPYDMADPCGEDSHMPIPGLVRRLADQRM